MAGVCGLMALALGSSSHAQVVVNEQFTDGERLTQALPDSLQWTVGAHHATAATAFGSLDASGQNLLWDHTSAGGTSFSGVWAHFTPAGAPLTLGIGEKLTLGFDVSFSGGSFATNSANVFRFQLFNSGGSRVTTDFAGTSEPGLNSGTTFSNWRGYEGTLPINSALTAADNFLVRERTGTGVGLNASANWTNLSGTGVVEPTFTAGTTYSGLLELTRTALGTDIRATLAGVSSNLISDNSGPVTGFDTISFFVTDAMSHNIILDNIQVTHIVPEPAAVGLLAPLLIMIGRRRRAK